jgi:hypothetical protein
LSVSPDNLGTGLSIEATVDIAGTDKTDRGCELQRKLNDHLLYSKSIKVKVDDLSLEDGSIQHKVHLQTVQMLAPNYNEMI